MNTRLWLCCSAALVLTMFTGHADSLWAGGSSVALVADKKAQAVGDIVTILVQESSTASKDNSTKTAKESAIDAGISTFLYSPAASSFLTRAGTMPALKTSAKNSFTGGGTVNNKEEIVARVAVTVTDTLPNGNLVIEGRRTTAFSGETQDIVLRGVIRTADISANNTIFSYNVANATVTFINKGSVANQQRKGWFGKLWELVDPF